MLTSLASMAGDRAGDGAGEGRKTKHPLSSELRNVRPVASALFAALNEALPCDRASIVVINAAGEAEMVATFAVDGNAFVARKVPISDNIRRVLSSRAPVVNPALTPYDDGSRAVYESGIRSTIVVPLLALGRVIGTLNVGSVRENTFDAADAARVGKLAAPYAQALDNAIRFSGGTVVPEATPGSDAPPSSRRHFLLRPESVLEQMNDAVLIDDVDGRVVYANRAFREMFGVAESELDALVLEDYVAPEWRAALRKRHDDRVRGVEVPSEFEYRAMRKDGTTTDVEVSVTAIVEGGVTLGTQSVIRDVGERRALEQRAVHAQKMEALGQLAGGIAHDFNNLLTALSGYPHIIRKRHERGLPIEKALSEIEIAAERAAVLTTQLLTFSRKQVVRVQAVEVSESVRTLVPMLRRLIEDDIELVSRLGQVHDAINIDPGQLDQILINMVVNARDARPSRIVVEVTAVELDSSRSAELGLKAGRHVVLSVSDDGSGMSPDVASRVFQPFFTTKPVGSGTGLGLATAYGIVNSAGGVIQVETELGVGTTFEIYLRAEQASQRASMSSAPPPEVRFTAHALVVEDDAVSRRVLRALLEGSGFRVTTAENGRLAATIIEDLSIEIDVVISDMVMPVAGGEEVFTCVKQHRPDLPLILMSGYAKGKLAEQLPELDAPFMQKPIARSKLIEMLVDVLPTTHRELLT